MPPSARPDPPSPTLAHLLASLLAVCRPRSPHHARLRHLPSPPTPSPDCLCCIPPMCATSCPLASSPAPAHPISVTPCYAMSCLCTVGFSFIQYPGTENSVGYFERRPSLLCDGRLFLYYFIVKCDV
ncbi:hypothetical protein DENSPDRAFT_661728 [Dentipellis sp. KUC8613]|nr:hypothetical protein DENSPDRAFT_661728 [Dentipellis sp. KUC8613]